MDSIEIKNDVNSLLAIFVPGETTKTDIIQTIHRFRQVKNITMLFVDIPNFINDFKDEHEDKNIKNTIDALCNLTDYEREKFNTAFEKLIVFTVSFFFYTQNLKGGGRCVEKDE